MTLLTGATIGESDSAGQFAAAFEDARQEARSAGVPAPRAGLEMACVAPLFGGPHR